eukprot:9546562-Prorocentrum_lima.AAC.1
MLRPFGTGLMRDIVEAIQRDKVAPSKHVDSLLQTLLGKLPRPSMTLSAQARLLGRSSVTHLGASIMEYAACTLLAARNFISS